jgi:uroporphyrinogen-III decarboxylase
MNPLLRLMNRFKKGGRPVFKPGPFLPLTLIRQRGLVFNTILRETETMAEAALLSFELGFDSTTLPFDLNVEAEVLGGTVNYHDEVDGNPVYPTMGLRRVETAEDVHLADNLAAQGRLPEIIKCLRRVKDKAASRGAVGVFLPGPFTLAGQVMDPEKLFVLVLKKPEETGLILERLTDMIRSLRDIYVEAGADFVVIGEGGAATISPRAFDTLLLPCLFKIFENKAIPQVLTLMGRSEKVIEMALSCHPDALGVDQECALQAVRSVVPQELPLFSICGAYDLLAKATPDEIRIVVRACLDQGLTFPVPPADIYPPARIENILAFVDEVRNYAVCR